MEEYVIDCEEAANDIKEYILELKGEEIHFSGNCITTEGQKFAFDSEYIGILEELNERIFGSVSKSADISDGDNNNDLGTGVLDEEISDDNGSIGDSDVLCDSNLRDIPSLYSNSLIYGKNTTENVVSVEVKDDQLYMFLNDGTVIEKPMEYWILSNRSMGSATVDLEGGLFYNKLRTFESEKNYKKARGILYGKNANMFNIYDNAEAAMIREGITPFKGMKVQDVSILSFDIETTGIAHNEDSKVLMISNTYRDIHGKVTKKLFDLAEYKGHDSLMIEKWSEWVQEIDPSVMTGHNIFGFDLPYLSYCFIERNPHHKNDIYLGKDGSSIKYSPKPKKFRKDGSQSYDYHEAKIFGRQIIDTFFLAIKFDFGRKYPSYGLKAIIETEGLEKKGRIKWDFENIKPKDLWEAVDLGATWSGEDEAIDIWKKFREYCEDDADDSLKLWDLMIPQFFYYNQSLSMNLQTVNNTATGRQINGLLVRAYIQDGHSIPQPEERVPYEGGISYGNPGLYKHVYKVDVASLYPSVMITEEIYNREKDPKGKFLEMVTVFTKERLINKAKGRDTGDRYFKDLEQGQKIVINSAYGLLGTAGLNFNSFKDADKTTRVGREILTTGIDWAKEKGFQIVNVDTDSFSYTSDKAKIKIDAKKAKKNGVEERNEFDEEIVDLNKLFKDGIIWEDDGYFPKFLVIKAKNYILVDEKKNVKIKGSALKATMKEKRLKDFLDDVIVLLLAGKRDHLYSLYQEYVREIKDEIVGIDDMRGWAMKKTVTKAVLNPERKQEQKVLDAIQDIDYQEGDKVFLYSVDSDTLKLVDDFDGNYDKVTYYNKLYKTLEVFDTVIDTSLFPNYKLGRNKVLI